MNGKIVLLGLWVLGFSTGILASPSTAPRTAEEQFRNYLRMMESDQKQYNFFHAVRRIAKHLDRYRPFLEGSLHHPDPQVVLGVTTLLMRVPAYAGNPEFYRLLTSNLRGDDLNLNNVYVVNAYEATLWLHFHYREAREEIVSGLEGGDLQQRALLSLLIAKNEPSFDFSPQVPAAWVLSMGKELNRDRIRYNATWAAVFLIMAGSQYPDQMRQLAEGPDLDSQGKKLLAFIRGKNERNDRVITFEHCGDRDDTWGTLGLRTPWFLGSDPTKRHEEILSLSGDIALGYRDEPFLRVPLPRKRD